MLSWASEAPLSSNSPAGAFGMQEDMAPIKAAYHDFQTRLGRALESRELASVAALYQTNDVTAAELNSELARWRQLVAEGAEPRPWYFKSLSHLPPESHKHWEARAQRLTRHPVTDFAFVQFQGGSQMIVPLCLVGNTLLMVPSEKINKSIENGAANGSQAIRSETNQTSGAAGSRR
jgi:hypothetical protein